MFFDISSNQNTKVLEGIPEGADALILSDLREATSGDLIYVGKNDQQIRQIKEILNYLIPQEEVHIFPAWDCVPYDRVSPRRDLQAQRSFLLGYLTQKRGRLIILTTPSAFLQKVPKPLAYENTLFHLKKGESYAFEDLQNRLIQKGFSRVTSVHEPGEFAVRGGLLDIFAPQESAPVRIDFFGDQIERMRFFDPMTQRSLGEGEAVTISQGSELAQNSDVLQKLAQGYRAYFNHPLHKDIFYQTIFKGLGAPGLEHFMPLYHQDMGSILEYLKDPMAILADGFEGARTDRWNLIQDHYQTRLQQESMEGVQGEGYHPLEPQLLYMEDAELPSLNICLSSFQSGKGHAVAIRTIVWQGNQGDRFTQLQQLFALKKPIHIFCESPALQERLKALFYEKEFLKFEVVQSFDAHASPKTIKLHQSGITHSYETPHHILIAGQELLGLGRKMEIRKSKRADLLLSEASSLEVGDYIVHEDQGIGQFKGLITLDVLGAKHDCFEIMYAGGDKLFVPVENSDVLTRFGGEGGEVILDRLGSAAWQGRKAKIKKRLREIAQHLIELAAARQVVEAPAFEVQHPDIIKFEDSFTFEETEDQQRAIEDTFEDLHRGKPMDRLICGDVGFGKTEVAMRAAFVVASQGKQVAVITPTTLLCRQHFKNFQERLTPFGISVAQMSRFVTPKQTKDIKERLAQGRLDVVIGTHSLLSKDVNFADLGLVVVDEEQHFGVKQKEKLKALQKDVHLLTLSATPIPRTLQMALTGVRDMSIIATSPVDRLAIRTFVTPYDALIVKEAIERELHRQGQIFYVCPRLKDIPDVRERLQKLMPDLRIAVATGQMAAHDLEDVMDAFMNREYDLLLATNIIESGIDISSVNTLFIHKSDMFGLSQLYQLRGRIGRGKVRGYAYFLLPDGVLSANGQKRLEVMQTLDSLGAGFQLASYDMDIRGAGNLLGDEQSGHVREVGIELYQQMLEEAVQSLKHTDQSTVKWQPEINIPISVLIPDDYVADLPLRLSLYRRLSRITDQFSLDDFQDELVDRFGPLPGPCQNLLNIMALKILCHGAHVERVDVGDKGCVLTFHQNQFPAPDKLVSWCMGQQGTVRMRPDHKIVFTKVWPTDGDKILGVHQILKELNGLLVG